MKINREDIIRAYKYAKDGSVLLETSNEGLSEKEIVLRMQMVKSIFDKFGYFYSTYMSGNVKNDGKYNCNITYVFPYPNATVETFGEMIVKLQKIADDYDYTCFICDSIETNEILYYATNKKVA